MFARCRRRHAGGRAYGYRAVLGKPGVLEVVNAEADVIRRIFAAYAAGESPRSIAGALNADNIAPPRGAKWNASTINGSRQRETGIIQNALYSGKIVWNKAHKVKDPDTGKRVSRINARKDWQWADAPHLAIIDPGLFAAVQQRKAALSRDGTVRDARRPRHLLSGLLVCGVCGAGMSVHDRDKTGKTRARCSTQRESGACEHCRVYYLEGIERVVVEGLRSELRAPVLIAEFVKVYQEERQRLARTASRDRARVEHRLGEIRRALTRLVDALADGLTTAGAVREKS